jgi:hypothetical protein
MIRAPFDPIKMTGRTNMRGELVHGQYVHSPVNGWHYSECTARDGHAPCNCNEITARLHRAGLLTKTPLPDSIIAELQHDAAIGSMLVRP